MKIGKHGTVPLLEDLDELIHDWMDNENIIVDSKIVEAEINDDSGEIVIILRDGKV